MSTPDNLEAIWAAPFGDSLDALDSLWFKTVFNR